MKKLLALSVALALFGTAAFAEISIGAWGRAAFVPLDVKTAGKSTAEVESTWGNYSVPREIRLQFSGANETKTLGFQLWLQTDGGNAVTQGQTVGFGDWAAVWAKPWSFLRVDIGRYNGDALRGKVGADSAFNQYIGGSGYGNAVGTTGDSSNDNDAIFPRLRSRSLDSALLSITPVEGLFIGANFENLGGNALFPDTTTTPAQAGAYDKYTFAAGYNIAGFLPLRVQWAGKGSFAAGGTSSALDAAIGYTGLEGLVVDLGVKIPIAVSSNETAGNTSIALGAAYSLDAFAVTGLVNLGFGSAFGVSVYAEPTYKAGPVVLGLPLRYGNIADGDSGVGAYAKYPLAGGYVQAGVAADIGFGGAGTRISIPLIIEYGL